MWHQPSLTMTTKRPLQRWVGTLYPLQTRAIAVTSQSNPMAHGPDSKQPLNDNTYEIYVTLCESPIMVSGCLTFSQCNYSTLGLIIHGGTNFPTFRLSMESTKLCTWQLLRTKLLSFAKHRINQWVPGLNRLGNSTGHPCHLPMARGHRSMRSFHCHVEFPEVSYIHTHISNDACKKDGDWQLVESKTWMISKMRGQQANSLLEEKHEKNMIQNPPTI